MPERLKKRIILKSPSFELYKAILRFSPIIPSGLSAIFYDLSKIPCMRSVSAIEMSLG
jgi:uncharacterized membrane protein YdjX (TVP38/TMEM64 family)